MEEVQEITHFPVAKVQGYLLTFHTLVSHLHPDVTKSHNDLSGQHISLSPFFFFSQGQKSVPYLHVQSGPRRTGATCSRAHNGGARGLRWRLQGVGQASAAAGVERETQKALSGLRLSGQRGSLAVLYSPE